MHTVFIADDELIIRQGLQCVIEWNDLGFEIAGEAANGEEALKFILSQQPDVAMLDIRMPGLNGLEVAKRARDKGYQGYIIILSGFSEFRYAQEAIRHGVKYYLTKPIDENELTQAITEIGNALSKKANEKENMEQYRDRTRNIILCDILKGEANISSLNLTELCLDSDAYQVVIYEKYNLDAEEMPYLFSDLLNMTQNDNMYAYETLDLDSNQVLLLKGNAILSQFQNFLERYEREEKPQSNSPLDSLFITYGRTVERVEDISISYGEALRLLRRRFFCEYKQHTIGYLDLPTDETSHVFELNDEVLQNYREKLVGFLQTSMRNHVAETLNELEKNLYRCKEGIPQIKLFLTDLYLSIKEKISHLYHNTDISFPGNADIIKQIDEKYYLYQIVLFFTEQFEMIMLSIGSPSSSGVMEDIIHYIEHNYMDNIKLETIAPLFGYNSSYLGKIFTKKVGIGFNVFVDQIRINHSKDLLTKTELKVYEIAEQVGYRNVDYFHTKFKKYVNLSPAEYRRKMQKN
ncbi:MAG: response regulator [Lachnospiraceae bacterium]|nr:response regulator [Lachnospiraceae bacterium]